VGAALTAWLAATQKLALALVIGVVFLAGGVANAFMLSAPLWFEVFDIVAAYIPVAWLGARPFVKRA
jgi:hypothetical protein